MIGAPRTIVVGLGNPILCDDGVGWRIVAAAASRIRDTRVDVRCASVGGLRLMEMLVGYDVAVLADAIVTGADTPGTVRRFRLEDLPVLRAGHTCSAHDATLLDALHLARRLGAHVPSSART